MNQQILFNDDIIFNDQIKAWVFTGLLAGERITIEIISEEPLELSDALKFDFEFQVEEWLEDNEPPVTSKIKLVYK
jgi:hypothetical protein